VQCEQVVRLPCNLADTVTVGTAGLLYLAYQGDRLGLTAGGPDGSATGTLSLSGGRYEQGAWTPDPNSEPVHLTVALEEVYSALTSVDECADTGRHFTETQCPTAACNVASPPDSCLVAKCGYTNCGIGNNGCGITCTSTPGCAHAKTHGSGFSETCGCQPGYCVAVSEHKTKTCTKNLGLPLPESCHGTVTGACCGSILSASSQTAGALAALACTHLSALSCLL
jgi:hypothetical protein